MSIIFGVLKEEVSLFFKEQRETGKVDPTIIHFGFSEIGVDGKSKGYRRGNLVEKVHSWLKFKRIRPR